MLSFPLNPSPTMPWAAMPLGRSIFSVLEAVTFMPSPSGAPFTIYDAQTMYILAVSFVAVNVALLAYAVYLYVQEDDFINGITIYRPNWPIRALRTCGRVSVMALFVPLFSILLMPFSCAQGGVWWNSSLACWTGTHALFVALSVVFLPLLFLFSLLVAGMYIDRRPDPKRNLLSQPHGRVAPSAKRESQRLQR